jgi:hypothetical protein
MIGSFESSTRFLRPQSKGVDFILPSDVVVADKFAEDANNKVVSVDSIPDGWMVSKRAGQCDGVLPSPDCGGVEEWGRFS